MGACVGASRTATTDIPPSCNVVHYICGYLPTLLTMGYVLSFVPCCVCIPTSDFTVYGGGKGKRFCPADPNPQGEW